MRKVIILCVFVIIGLVANGVNWFFFDTNRFKQELIAESYSPDSAYTIHAYLNNSHATTSYTVLGELVFNDENKSPKKIYWAKAEEAIIEWIDENTVVINEVQLKIPYERYDYRSGIIPKRGD